MAKFSVTVEETFTRRYEIEAKDENDARNIVERGMAQGAYSPSETLGGCHRSSKIDDICRMAKMRQRGDNEKI